MISKQELLDMMLRECQIVVHLHSKVPAEGLDFRFTPAQRSTIELMRYLSYVGVGATRGLAEGSFEAYNEMAKDADSLTSEEFPAAMKRQADALRAVFSEFTDKDLSEREVDLPWGQSASLASGILMLAYGSLVAYRMQLFLHAKAAGNADIGTANCWGGMDMPAS